MTISRESKAAIRSRIKALEREQHSVDGEISKLRPEFQELKSRSDKIVAEIEKLRADLLL